MNVPDSECLTMLDLQLFFAGTGRVYSVSDDLSGPGHGEEEQRAPQDPGGHPGQQGEERERERELFHLCMSLWVYELCLN